MSIRDKVLRAAPLCYICKEKGIITPAKEVDHKTPLFMGGTDDWDNLAGVCTACHLTKSIKERGDKQSPPIGIDGWPEGFK